MLLRLYSLLAAVLIAWSSGACTVLTSETAADLRADGRAPRGVNYMLPKGLVDISLWVSREGLFELTVGPPKYVPDPRHRYFLRYRPHPSYDDEITVKMSDSGLPFLKSVSSITTDKTGEVLVSLAKAAGALSPRFQGGRLSPRLLGQFTVDPTDPRDMAQASEVLDGEMRRYIRKALRGECAARDAEDRQACVGFALLEARAKREPLVQLSANFTQQARFQKPADCTIGVCYRPKEPVLLNFTVGGVNETRIVEVPNAAEPIALDIKRAFLVKRVHELTFDDDGFLIGVTISKESELLAAAKLPVQIASAVAEGLQLRIDITQKTIENDKAEAELIRSRAKLREQQEKARFQSGREGKEEKTVKSYTLEPGGDAEEEEPPPAKPAAGAPGKGAVDDTLLDQAKRRQKR